MTDPKQPPPTREEFDNAIKGMAATLQGRAGSCPQVAWDYADHLERERDEWELRALELENIFQDYTNPRLAELRAKLNTDR